MSFDRHNMWIVGLPLFVPVPFRHINQPMDWKLYWRTESPLLLRLSSVDLGIDSSRYSNLHSSYGQSLPRCRD